MLMPYGRFKGKELDELPSAYLLWLAENIKEDTERNKALCLSADKEWQFREKHNLHK
jgi:hypothetical protein